VRGAFQQRVIAARLRPSNQEVVTPVPNPASDQETSRSLKRWIPLVAIICVVVAAYVLSHYKDAVFQNIAANRANLQDYITHNWLKAILIYALVYATAVAFSFPAAGLITVIGGLLFGWLAGAIATVVAATTGATLIFLAAKTSFEKVLSRKSGPMLTRVRDGFAENAFSYLLFLRLVPLFPFWLVNIAAALARIKLSTFIPATFIGIIPITLVFSFVGSSLDGIIESQRAAYDVCMAGASHLHCRFDISLRHIVTPQILLALACLGVLALTPVIVKKLRGKP
jgi:uncharacterized membrane protein YdjX (TVP38/TMEM64 family)